MRKILVALLVSITAVIGLSACGGSNETGPEADKVSISVTFNALKEFATAVGGDKVEVSTIIPEGTEPHDFEPKAQDLAGLNEADIFVYNGLGMEPWVEVSLQAADNDGLIMVEASKGVDPIKNLEEEEINEHGQYDPHIWLSLKGAGTMAANIKDALIKADPANKDYYEKNCADFVAALESLYSEFRDKLQSAAKKDFVTGHAAFAYLCRDFDLKQSSVEDVFAEGEPTAQSLAELVEYCKENGVTTIFAEEMVSPAVSQTLADEVGAKVEAIYTMESSEDNISYIDRMRDNLQKIYESLK